MQWAGFFRASVCPVHLSLLMAHDLAFTPGDWFGDSAPSSLHFLLCAHHPLKPRRCLSVCLSACLQQLDITFRRDPTNFRPRINKYGSVKDMEQKKAGTYFYLED